MAEFHNPDPSRDPRPRRFSEAHGSRDLREVAEALLDGAKSLDADLRPGLSDKEYRDVLAKHQTGDKEVDDFLLSYIELWRKVRGTRKS